MLGVDAGPSEDAAFWTAFLRGLKRRGLQGVQLVISDAHEGIKAAVGTVLTGATWQRCRGHFMRNLLAVVPKGAREAVAAVVRTVFAQPDHASALAQLRRVVEGCGRASRRRRRGSRRRPRTSWRTCTSPPLTGASSTPPISRCASSCSRSPASSSTSSSRR